MLKVEVFSSPGCGKCAQARTVLKGVAEALGPDRVSWREVNILEEMDYAVDLGVMASPSIAIDGELIFTSLPSAVKLRAELLRRLDRS
ncbi:glutaredoxin family protein [Thiobacillus denitrificans]|uniref:Thioredoxin n=1 Tax=Thiobacillus denitrificans TaxID=36861 RepID=A0A106BFJ3_THIDE|nr:thioredoxin family protein [Thiobacillus denitrificans]KVW91335.1 thioredoxin [Thiobacillus denitrificans]